MIDIVIIGAGPCGLSVGSYLKENSNKTFKIIDMGEEINQRSRTKPSDIVTGVGASGLLSDGKFSFYPSASKLWELSDKKNLSDSYQWYVNLLKKYYTDSDIPCYPNITGPDTEHNINISSWYLKEYKSIYLSLEARYKMISDLYTNIGSDNFILNTMVINVKKCLGYYEIFIKDNKSDTLNSANPISNKIICCKNIVLAGGRFNIFNSLWDIKFSMIFRRLEYGIRIQSTPEKTVFTETTIKDPKYKLSAADAEYRTFCICRRGEVIKTDFNGMITYSGRSDCAETNLSNLGFNVRILDKMLSEQILTDMMTIKETFNDIKFMDAINTNILEKFIGKYGSLYLINGLKLFLERFPDMADSTLIGPTLEGMGSYVLLTNDLKVETENIWVGGDATGIFRGITASMVSGYYIGKQLKN
jgi:uncharacterized FAD-dependent dehydrogenase